MLNFIEPMALEKLPLGATAMVKTAETDVALFDVEAPRFMTKRSQRSASRS
jgi:hypothetical protein